MATKHPRFVRTNSWSYVRVKTTWRKPRGIDSKQRQKLKSAGAVPKIGYQGAKSVRHTRIANKGAKEVLIHNLKELAALKGQKLVVAKIGGTVGELKRMAIRKEAKALKKKVLN